MVTLLSWNDATLSTLVALDLSQTPAEQVGWWVGRSWCCQCFKFDNFMVRQCGNCTKITKGPEPTELMFLYANTVSQFAYFCSPKLQCTQVCHSVSNASRHNFWSQLCTMIGLSTASHWCLKPWLLWNLQRQMIYSMFLAFINTPSMLTSHIYLKAMTLRRRGRGCRRWPFPFLGGRFRIVIAQGTRGPAIGEVMLNSIFFGGVFSPRYLGEA